MRAAKLWPLALAGVLGVTVAANVVILYLAHDRDAAAIEPDYYAKALRWDSVMAGARASAALGWTLDAALVAPDARGATVAVRLADAAGAPLEGATVRVEAVHNLEAAHPLKATLLPGAPGDYAARLPLDRRGSWELRFDVRRGADRFVAVLRREAGAAEAPGSGDGTARP